MASKFKIFNQEGNCVKVVNNEKQAKAACKPDWYYEQVTKSFAKDYDRSFKRNVLDSDVNYW